MAFCEAVAQCVDLDGDGAGRGCARQDCRPRDVGAFPGADEVCSGGDNDCDGVADDELSGCPDCSAAPDRSTPELAELLEGAEVSGYLCGDQQELWRLPGGTTGLLAAVARTPGAQPVTMSLYREGESSPIASSTSPANVVELAIEGVGAHYLGLSSTSIADEPYQLAVRTLPSSCENDVWEPNGSPSNAAALWTDHAIHGALCINDLDFFEIQPLAAGTVVNVELVHPTDSDPVLLEVWRQGRAISPVHNSGAGYRHAHVRLDRDDAYQIALRPGVLAGFGEAVPWAMAVSRWVPPACQDDDFETVDGVDNDELADATPLTGTREGVLCHGDVDFYDIGDYGLDDFVDVMIQFDAGSANLDAVLYFESVDGFAQLARGDGAPERLPTGVSRAGRYYVAVFGRGPTDSAPYTIEVVQ